MQDGWYPKAFNVSIVCYVNVLVFQGFFSIHTFLSYKLLFKKKEQCGILRDCVPDDQLT